MPPGRTRRIRTVTTWTNRRTRSRMEHVIKKKKKRGLWPKLAIRHGQAEQCATVSRRKSLFSLGLGGAVGQPFTIHSGEPHAFPSFSGWFLYCAAPYAVAGCC